MTPQPMPPLVVSVAEIAHRVQAAGPRLGPTRVVLIDGPAGSGKTTLAARLWQALGSDPVLGQASIGDDAAPLPVQVLHADDMYEGWDGLPTLGDVLIDQVLAPMARGGAGRFRVWDWHRAQRAGEVEVSRPDVLIVEGVGVAMRRAREVASLVLWVEASPAERLRRGLARDGEGMRDEWLRWQRAEQEEFARQGTRAGADILIDGDRTLQP
ncbi:uridine kinase [Demequina sp. SO4-13]|uniref:uridine kinase n=1 Tax=Demequina sp. SO4-13 TaxID=3401027 RepID=UPI003AF43D7C